MHLHVCYMSCRARTANGKFAQTMVASSSRPSSFRGAFSRASSSAANAHTWRQRFRHICRHLANARPVSRPQNTLILIIGTPKKVPLILGNLLVLSFRKLSGKTGAEKHSRSEQVTTYLPLRVLFYTARLLRNIPYIIPPGTLQHISTKSCLTLHKPYISLYHLP